MAMEGWKVDRHYTRMRMELRTNRGQKRRMTSMKKRCEDEDAGRINS